MSATKTLTKILAASSRMTNTLLGGDDREMFSSRVHRNAKKGYRSSYPTFIDLFWIYAEVILDKIFFWQEDHCLESYLWEREQFATRNEDLE